MKYAVLGLLLFLAPPDDETYPVILTFESMHCAECRRGVEGGLKALAGVKKVTVDESSNRVTLLILEKTPVLPVRFRKAVPSDLKITSCEVTLRGTVAPSEKTAVLRAKVSRQELTLKNHRKKGEPEKDRVGNLLRQVTPEKNKFRITGFLEETKKGTFFAITSFERTEWKK